jgi:hypothetical protein
MGLNCEYDLPVAPTKEKQGGVKPSPEELKVKWGCTAAIAGVAMLLCWHGWRNVCIGVYLWVVREPEDEHIEVCK